MKALCSGLHLCLLSCFTATRAWLLKLLHMSQTDNINVHAAMADLWLNILIHQKHHARVKSPNVWRHAGYIQAHPGSNGSAPAAVASKPEQRHSDAGSNPSKISVNDDVILSGNLEQLSQQLQSATAMFNSHSAPPTSRAPYSTSGEGGSASSGSRQGSHHNALSGLLKMYEAFWTASQSWFQAC